MCQDYFNESLETSDDAVQENLVHDGRDSRVQLNTPHITKNFFMAFSCLKDNKNNGSFPITHDVIT